MRLRHICLLAVAIVLAIGGEGGVAKAAPVKITMGWIVPVNDMISIFSQAGVAQQDGKSYVLEPIHFQGSTQMVTALASGDLDIASLGFSSFPFAVENAGLDDARIIADQIQDGVPGYFTSQFRVLKDGAIKSVKDLRGKTLATNALGSGVDIAMRAMLAKNGLNPQKDVTIIEAPFPTMKAQLLEKKVVLIPSVLPFAEDPQLTANSTVLFSQREALGTSELSFSVAREGFIQKHRAALVDFLEDYLRATRFYTDPRSHAKVVQIAAQFSKIPAKVFEGWLYTKKDFYRGRDALPNLAALQSNIDLEKRIGFIKSGFDAKKYADLSLIQEAAARLK